jgi:hypothetical protein
MAAHVPITDWQLLEDLQTTISLTYDALYRQHSVLALSNWVDTIATSLNYIGATQYEKDRITDEQSYCQR